MLRMLLIALMLFNLLACTKQRLSLSQPQQLMRQQQVNQIDRWWLNFNDPQLNHIMDVALTRNLDIQIALANIQQARANEKSATANLFPQLNAEASGSTGYPGYLVYNQRLNYFQPDFNLNWEIDLFGVNRNIAKANKAYYRSSVYNWQNVSRLFAAEVVKHYIELRSYQQQLEVINANVRSSEDIFHLTKSLYHSGLQSDLDTERSQALYLQLQADAEKLRALIVTEKNALTTLCALPTASLNEWLDKPGPLPKIRDKFILKNPIDIINTRPDVAEAEQDLMAATYLTKSSIAKIFPRLNFSAFYGLQDTNLLPGSVVWGTSLYALANLIDFGRIKSQIDFSNAKQQEAYLQYHKTILVALEEIQTAYAHYHLTKKQAQLLSRSASKKKLSFTLAKIRYSKGLSNYIDVLTTERDYFDSKNEYVLAQAAAILDAIKLYESLGVGS